MSLDYPSEWRFEGIGEPISDSFHFEALDLVSKIATGSGKPKRVYEMVQEAFGGAGSSSDAGWAESDMRTAMRSKTENAVEYVDSLWNVIEQLEQDDVKTPSVEHFNKLLHENDVPLQIVGSSLQLVDGDVTFSEDATEGQDEASAPSYVQHEQIGRGGFGEVFRVSRMTAAGTFEFAMKVLEPSPFNENHEKAWKRFTREIDSLSSLQHRGIVQYIEAGRLPGGKPYIIMPLIEGEDFQRALSGRQLAEVVRIFDLLLEALEYAHGQQILHRDIRPNNVLVRTSDQQPVLLDFGCAYLLDKADQETLTTRLIGSRPYIPPEVLNDPTIRSPKQDIFACGVMLYQALTSVFPEAGDYESLSHTNEAYGGLDTVVQGAIAPARKRISTVAELRDSLRRVAK